MLHARLTIDLARPVGPVSRRLFGAFVEHVGRGVYGGIHEPGHPSADEDGLGQDVIDLVKEMGVTTVRYPGGNVVSGFRWEDSVGPRGDRPVRLNHAWHGTEMNEVGLHEFASWQLAARTAKAMRQVDPHLELVACGSSGADMPTFGEWERVVLTHAYEDVDFISCQVPAGLAKRIDDWPVAPPISEEPYTVADGVVVGNLLMSLIRHADRVTSASMAQLVNVIASIAAEPHGPAWRMSTFFPFATTLRLARAVALRVAVDGPTYGTAEYGEVPLIDAAATADAAWPLCSS